MAFMRRGVLAASLILAWRAGAERKSSEVDHLGLGESRGLLEGEAANPAERTAKIFADPKNQICGGEQIRTLLTAHPSVDGVRNTPWSKIMAIASAYLQAQATEIPKLEAEVTRLIAAIASMEKKEAITPLTEEQLRGLITSAVTAPDTYGSVGNAVESKCGAADRKVCRKLQPPVKASAYKKSTAAFEAAAKALFDGSVKTDGASFRKVCDAMLPGDTSGTVESYCDELCQSFADLAQVTSDSTAGAKAGSSSDKLREQLQGKQKDLQYAMSEKSECETAKESLEGFMAQLEDLQKDIKVEFAKVQDAREALGEFEDQVFDLEDDLERQQGETAKAVRLAGEAGVKTQLAKAALEEVRKNEMSLKTQLKEAKNSLESAKAELEKAHQADIAVQQLRGLVSQTLLNMVAYVNEAVLEPVRRIGLGEDVEVNDRFAQGLEGLPTAGDFKGSVTNLLGYCQETALPAFKLLQAGVKLAPICEVGPVEKVVPGVFSAVEVRAADVKKHLKSVQSWLDPYKGQKKMSKAEAERLVKEGEPTGLREAMGVFSQTNYYSKYLKRWKKIAKPSFLDLYAQLGKTLAGLRDTVRDLTTSTGVLTDTLKKVGEQRQAAADKLSKATTAAHLAGQKGQAAQAALQTLREQTSQAKDRLQGLNDALDGAIKRYEAAKDQLETTHHKGTSMLEEWEDAEAEDGLLEA